MISCEQYDYIEIACLYRYQVLIVLTSGEHFTGQAVDTCVNRLKQECLKLNRKQGQIEIRLEDIHLLKVLSRGAKFQELLINQCE